MTPAQQKQRDRDIFEAMILQEIQRTGASREQALMTCKLKNETAFKAWLRASQRNELAASLIQ